MIPGPPHRLPLIIGHRGASHDAPENTLAAFRLAWQQGADGIEADFRLTADGHIVCMHDATAVRTTGADFTIADATLKELRTLDAGQSKGYDLSDTFIPTLGEVLSALPEGSWFFIEIKSGAEIIASLESTLLKSGCSPDRIRLLSFSVPLIKQLVQRLPEWHSCLLCDYRHNNQSGIWHPSGTELINTLVGSGAAGLASAYRELLDRDLVAAIREIDRELHVWTVDRLPSALRLCALGVDSIMTNRPGLLRRRLAQQQSL